MDNLLKFREIMKKYKNGEYGSITLHLNEILEKAGCPNLIDEMSAEELEILSNESSGITKTLFLSYKRKNSK